MGGLARVGGPGPRRLRPRRAAPGAGGERTGGQGPRTRPGRRASADPGSSAHGRRTREDVVDDVKQWTVTIDIDEHEGHTRAVARLHDRDSERLTGVGLARLDPADRDVPEIGDEIAAARA